MKKLKWVLLFCLVAVCAHVAMAQGGKSFSFNFNIDNGLPSNHVYYCLKDKFGYLWLATENGVVKYNGYDFKVFNLSSGLSNADVWFLLEDKKGRIWLSSISDEIGYLYNDEYHKPYFKALKTTIYPGSLSIFGSGVAFESKYVGDNGGDGLCVEQNDTIVVKQTLESLFDDIKPTDDYHNFIFPIVRGNGHLNIVKNRFIYDYNVQSKVLKQTVLLSDTSFLFKMGTGVSTFAENYTISGLVSLKPDNFSTLDIRTGVVNKVSLPLIGDRKIQSMFPARIGGPKNHFFVNTIDKALLYSADTSVRLVTSWDIKDLAGNSGVDGSKISNMLIDSFWGRAICSPSLGFFLAQKEENKFERDEKTDLKNFKFVGGASSGGGFWWNKENRTLAMSDINFNFTYHRLDNLRHLTSVLSVNNDSVAIFGSYTGIFSQKKGKVVAEGAYLSGMLQGIKKGRDTIISITYRGLAQLFHDKKGVLLFQIIDKDRYKGLIFDSLRNTYWAYADRKIYIHGEKCDSIICKDGILKFGVKKIEKVVFDNKFGNIFFKGNINGDAKLTMYSVEKRCFSELYNNFNLNNALVYIHNNTLITIGQFGILFRKVLGPNKLSGPIYYKNIKDFNYKRAYDLQVCKDKMLVNTDKGLFRLTMPPDDSFATVADNPKFVDYRFLVKNQKDVLDAKDGDTIRVSQKSPKLQFDVINPYGNGKVKYRYRLSDSNTWMELNANELNLPSLVPDNYYKISLFAEDNVWKSDELVIYWYVEPRWWQTHNAIKAIWFVSVLGAILILVISILITRRLVVRGNRKKNLQMELELKSIYAQINPHFIFNSLNAALLMVSKNNMDEAYRHISKFSRLLRSYIRSSRNRIISLEEESTNLRNYIELQQVRFDGRFSYEIIASPGINLTEVNIPSLLLQPFVENAINHGLLPKKGNGNLKISFHLPAGENTLYCDIEDDGVGREQSRLENESRGKLEESYGDLLIKDLVRIFRVYEKMKIDIAYIDKVAPESGTTVRIKIKYLENGK